MPVSSNMTAYQEALKRGRGRLSTYIMPVSSNMTAYQEALKRGRGRLKTFVYKRKEGLRTIKSVVEYQEATDEGGTRTIYFRKSPRS